MRSKRAIGSIASAMVTVRRVPGAPKGHPVARTKGRGRDYCRYVARTSTIRTPSVALMMRSAPGRRFERNVSVCLDVLLRESDLVLDDRHLGDAVAVLQFHPEGSELRAV